MNRRGKTILYIILAVTVGLAVFLAVKKAASGRGLVIESGSQGILAASREAPLIKVYVTGEVKFPGIVEIEQGSTILDAVNECGGFTQDASLNINLVYELKENVTLKIKKAADGGGAEVMEEAGDAVLIDAENGIIDGKININNADIASLCLLPGIGEKTAQDIMDYRESAGGFTVIEDLMNVPGIKDSRFSKLKDLICVN